MAKGPVALVGAVLLAYGVTALIFGGHSFSMHPLGGTVTGETWLALEVNGWSSLLFVAAGALLLFGSPLHWGAKTASLIAGLALGAAAVIALIDGSDVFGIFAANGWTKLVWGVAALVLLALALLPRAGRRREPDRPRTRERRLATGERFARDRDVPEGAVAGGRRDGARTRDEFSDGEPPRRGRH